MSSSTTAAAIIPHSGPYRAILHNFRRLSALATIGLLLWWCLVKYFRNSSTPSRSSGTKAKLVEIKEVEPSPLQLPSIIDGSAVRRRRRLKRRSARLPSLFVLLGIPGSGKTTWAQEYVLQVNENATIISSDAIRIERTGTITERNHEDDVLAALTEQVTAAAAEGKTIIVDDCLHNLSTSFRETLLNTAIEHNMNPIIKKLPMKPSFADSRIQRDIAEGKPRYIPTYAELEATYRRYQEAEKAVLEEQWFMETS